MSYIYVNERNRQKKENELVNKIKKLEEKLTNFQNKKEQLYEKKKQWIIDNEDKIIDAKLSKKSKFPELNKIDNCIGLITISENILINDIEKIKLDLINVKKQKEKEANLPEIRKQITDILADKNNIIRTKEMVLDELQKWINKNV